MKKMMMMIALAACAAAMTMTTTGCRSVTVENYGDDIVRDDGGKLVVLPDGKAQTVKKGWRVHHYQHWMNTTADSINATVKPEEIAFAMNGLNSKPSEELAKLVDTSLDGMTKLAVAVGDAYTKIAGGGAQADTVLKTSSRVIDYFRGKGGDVSKAAVAVDEAAKTLKVSDGSTCIECDADGVCTDCTP